MNIISKKSGSSGIVWAGTSNQWLFLEEPAWYVFKLIEKNQSLTDIAAKVASRFKLSGKDSYGFVSEISSLINQFRQPVKKSCLLSGISHNVMNNLYFTTFAKRNYRMKDKVISISYDSKLSEYYIHPPLAHLEISNFSGNDAHFDIFMHKDQPAIRRSNHPGFNFTCINFNLLKRTLFTEITNIIYDKKDEHWMSFLHASGISDGRETILLSSASGSGKSTMAALLQATGLWLVSDDYIPIDVRMNHVYPFPAAISIKEGAFAVLSRYYHKLSDKSYNIYTHAHPSVRYLHPMPDTLRNFTPLPLKTIIFIRYNPAVNCHLTPLSVKESLKLYLEQAWISQHPAHVKKFINWFLNVQCWQMEYSDIDKGIKAIINKFSDN